MAVDAFLVLTPVSGPVLPGETTDSYFGQPQFHAVEISNFSFGIHSSRTIGSTSGGAGAGKAQLADLKITKSVDRVSPILLEYAGAGNHLKRLDLYLRKAGGGGTVSSTNPQVYLQYSFALAFVTEVSTAGDAGSETVTEAVAFTYGALQVRYQVQQPDGSLRAVPSGVWNVISNNNNFNDPQLGL